ncbi:tetratricopeptide repeat protein [Janthinobacterium psychrotolerans]|uniref:protein O-GlcNAc transferase n=1 Tax=Janthinobacterium psychrotolerans TaxID=1747903 RepID=A0A1A7C9F0_9BURK|nr:tetratricopeptide repeat protein [Janthinobacterium psychrotolerans]OBV40938.1 putative O-linked N-acetylglucosamine transferase, SPINDLY family [Janthinobacterium psychrotolerans]
MPSSIPSSARNTVTAGSGGANRKADRIIAAAIANYRKLQASLPQDAEVHYAIGHALRLTGKTDDAQAAFRLAIKLKHNHINALKDYAALLHELERYEEAVVHYRAASLLAPEDPAIACSLGAALQTAGALDEALAVYRMVLDLMPDSASAHNNIGSVLQNRGQIELAQQSFLRALEIEPDFADALCNMGVCMMQLGRLEESLDYTRRAIALHPAHLQARTNLTAILFRQGRNDEVIEQCRRALEINPDWKFIHNNLLFSLSHSEQLAPAEVFAEHLRYAEQFEAPQRGAWPRHANVRDTDRRLRIGFVSADLYNHVVSSFITPVFEHLRHAPGLELLVYANSLHDDESSRHLKTLVAVWRQVEKLNDEKLAQLIIDDGIDILIDLSGHTGGNRLTTFARKPAPLQASWIGYPMTTGLQAMDYYISDRHFSPPGLLDAQFTEKLLRLPATAPFMPPAIAPAVSPAPALNNGHITFGSFNRPSKLSRKLIARWATLLRAAPDARMVMAGMSDDGLADTLRAWFAEEAIASERLDFYRHTHIAAYLKLHEQVDICLDTSPYAGGTTTLYALWMGVPTLTMTGPTLPCRVGAAVMLQAGLPEFIASDEADFIEKGIQFAGNLPHLAAIRMQARARMTNTAMGQPALIAAGLDHALRTIWQRWCTSLPPTSFESEPEQSTLIERARSHKALHEVKVDVALPLALEHHQAGRLEAAETLYLAILHVQADHAIANHNMGLLAGQLGYHDAALPYLHKALRSAGDESDFHYSYANGLLQAGQPQQALALIEAAMAQGHDSAQAQAIQHRARQLLAGTGDGPSQAEEEQLIALFEAGRHMELETAAQALVVHYPTSGFAWSVLGTALQVQGKDALQTLLQAVELAPGDAQALSNLGNEWQSHGHYAQAIACYERALELDPQFAAAHDNLDRARQALALAAENAEPSK